MVAHFESSNINYYRIKHTKRLLENVSERLELIIALL